MQLTDLFDQLFSELPGLLPTLVVVAVVSIVSWAVNLFLLRRKKTTAQETKFTRQIAVILFVLIGITLVLITLPITESIRTQLFSLFGLLLTAAIALSSTTIVANAMAGMMLRAVRSYNPGDFVRVENHFGRVTERGLFHTEIQTEDRDLMTLPNLYLISHPITVVRESGTIVSATVSLGYDVPHTQIEPLLVAAAKNTDLQDPFVQILELGDFSVTYRVAGFLPKVKQILTARSNLRKSMLDTLHGGGIEIVSPAFMNQRQLQSGSQTIPPFTHRRSGHIPIPEDQIPEERIFDKAEKAEEKELLLAEQVQLRQEIKELEERMHGTDKPERTSLKTEIERRQKRDETIARLLSEKDVTEEK